MIVQKQYDLKYFVLDKSMRLALIKMNRDYLRMCNAKVRVQESPVDRRKNVVKLRERRRMIKTIEIPRIYNYQSLLALYTGNNIDPAELHHTVPGSRYLAGCLGGKDRGMSLPRPRP